MSMKKWTDEELITTRDKLEAWHKKLNSSGSGSKLWLLTAFLGAFAISTGFAFIFFDGVDVLNVVLIILGTITCASWYRSEKQRKDNIAFLAEINKEIKSRAIKEPSKPKDKTDTPTSTNKEHSKSSPAAEPQTPVTSSKKIEEKS
jgi:hypothetical protein